LTVYIHLTTKVVYAKAPSLVGALLIAYDEAARVIQQAAQCDVLYNLTWFGSDSVAKSANITVNAPMEANHLKLFSLLPDEPDSQKYIEIKEKCMNATGGTFNVYYAYLYDSAFALARAIIETSSDNASKITAALPGICESTIGASGWLKLNRFGDRAPLPFTICTTLREPKPQATATSRGRIETIPTRKSGTRDPQTML
jgi:ABC-type branched-subunit amino acid transport system substrate-binding protein